MRGIQESPPPPAGGACEGSRADTNWSGWPIPGTVNPAIRASSAAHRQFLEHASTSLPTLGIEFAFIRFPDLYVCY
jgi:hypothetical protein